jgi:hypothetical protein
MSDVFEGVLLASPFNEVQQAIRTLSPSLSLQVETLDDLSIVSRNDQVGRPQFSPEIEPVAADLSKILGKALVVRYDSRIGHRTSELFINGNMEKAFDEDDEVWVLLDEDGKPLVDGERFKLADMDPDQEYDTVENAIQFGIQSFGSGDYKELRRFMGGWR